MNDNSKPDTTDTAPRRFRIIEVTKPNGHIHYEVQRRFWLFGDRWRTGLWEGCGDVEWAHEYASLEDARKALKIHLTSTTYKVVG